MKISIHAEGHHFIIPLPNGLVLNSVTNRIIAKYLNKYTKVTLTLDQLDALSIALKRAKKTLRKLPLVDVISSTGEKVKITL